MKYSTQNKNWIKTQPKIIFRFILSSCYVFKFWFNFTIHCLPINFPSPSKCQSQLLKPNCQVEDSLSSQHFWFHPHPWEEFFEVLVKVFDFFCYLTSFRHKWVEFKIYFFMEFWLFKNKMNKKPSEFQPRHPKNMKTVVLFHFIAALHVQLDAHHCLLQLFLDML